MVAIITTRERSCSMKFKNLLLLACFVSSATIAKTPLILLSIDGFAQHYLELYQPKTLNTMRQQGTSAKALLPVYPSKTFPNHVSIVTGKYPINHGILHNSFFHRDIGEIYSLGDGKKDTRWLTAKPIWHINEEQGNTSAIYFWPESESVINGDTPTFVEPYNHSVSNKERIDKIIDWLRLPSEQRPNFIAGYFSTVDSAGHDYGEHSKELIKSINELDNLLNDFMHTIEKEFNGDVNVIIISDHGMTKINKNNVIKWREAIAPNVKVAKSSTQLYLYSDDQRALAKTKQHFIEQQSNHSNAGFNVYEFPNYPEHWHLNKMTKATPNIIIDAKPSYIFNANHIHIDPETHGYDPKGHRELEAIFIATGPAFEKNKVINKFENIHLLPIMTRVLKLKDLQNIDGNYEIANSIVNKHITKQSAN